MIRDDIFRMAQEAGFDPHDMSDDFTCNLKDIERFAELLEAKVRKECARVIEDECHDDMTRAEEAAAIRARGEK